MLARLSPEEERVLSAIAAASQLKLATCSKAEAAIAWLSAQEPRALVFKANIARAERFCQAVRSKPRLAGVPLIALVSDPSDPFVDKLYAMGVDDAIQDRFGPGFVTRMKTLPDRVAEAPRRGTAVVAEPDRDRQNLVARVLANAGYDVRSAIDSISLAFYIQQHKPRLVVGSVALGPPRALISDARRRGYSAPWIVTARRRELHKHADDLGGLERVCVVASTSAPEVVLYAANELLRGEEVPARSEPRLLYATTLLFRSPGDETDELGFSYNVSTRGVFVRTLAPPEGDQVWLEARPPKSRRRVRLEGRVTWRRPYVPTAAPTGPPGFGVLITGGLSQGVEHWVQQVTDFAASAQASHLSVRRLHTGRIGDARTSGEYMLIEVPSESGVPVLSAVGERRSVPPTAQAVDDEWERLTDGDASTLDGAADAEHEAEEEGLADSEPPLEPEPVIPREPPLPRFDETEEIRSTAPASLPARQGVRSVLKSLLVGSCAGGLAAAAYFVWAGPPAPAKRTSAARPAAVVPAEGTSAAEPVVASAAPATLGSSLPVSSDAAAPAASNAALPDGSELAWDQGYLLVRAPGEHEVYATGFRVGATNRVNKCKCGLRWVRLGRGDPPRWISRGVTVDVKCRATTAIDLAPGASVPED